MNDFSNSVQKNKQVINFVLALLMFVFFAFCPVCDILGKAAVNGFGVLFDGRGLGFARFMSALLLILPIVFIILEFVDIKMSDQIKKNTGLICFALAILFFILFAVSLPKGTSTAWGAYLYFVLSIIGLFVSYLPKIVK